VDLGSTSSTNCDNGNSKSIKIFDAINPNNCLCNGRLNYIRLKLYHVNQNYKYLNYIYLDSKYHLVGSRYQFIPVCLSGFSVLRKSFANRSTTINVLVSMIDRRVKWDE